MAGKNEDLVPLFQKAMNLKEYHQLNPLCTPSSTTTSSYGSNNISVQHLNKHRVLPIRKIGQGCFGKVYSGVFCAIGTQWEKVAIKVLKNNASTSAKDSFMREVEIMSVMSHPNILNFIGICPRKKNISPWMILEYMEYGDLTELLRNSKKIRQNIYWNLPILTEDKLLFISFQISAGLKYLSCQGIVHRDLACRNCLVGKNFIVKIADFGMSRTVFNSHFYEDGCSTRLPVRWLPPESVSNGTFTLASDVWSFGVVLWEIYSFGKKPYDGYSNEQVLTFVELGILLNKPLKCPTIISEIMDGCWKRCPAKRLQITEIFECLKNFIARSKLDEQFSKILSMSAIEKCWSQCDIPPAEFSDGDNYVLPDDPKNISLNKFSKVSSLEILDDNYNPRPNNSKNVPITKNNKTYSLEILDDDCYLKSDELENKPFTRSSRIPSADFLDNYNHLLPDKPKATSNTKSSKAYSKKFSHNDYVDIDESVNHLQYFNDSYMTMW